MKKSNEVVDKRWLSTVDDEDDFLGILEDQSGLGGRRKQRGRE